MYSLDSNHYTKSFKTINELIDDIIECGQDTNCEITRNGKCTGEDAIDLIQF